MAVIVQRENGKFQAKIRRNGQPDQSKTFTRKSDAEAWARALEREMDIGSFINRNDAERTTFAMVADRFVKEVLPSKRGIKQDTQRLGRIVETFGKYSLASISSAMIASYRDDRLKAVGEQTVVHELGLLARVFKCCVMDWGIALPQGNPTLNVRKPRLPPGRDRRLELGEWELLRAALQDCKSPWPLAAVELAIETAGRQSELLSMKWSEIDLKMHVARFRGEGGRVTKNGTPWRDVPLTPRASAVLTALPHSTKGNVFPITKNALKLSWERAISRARQQYIFSVLKPKLQAIGIDADSEIRALVYKKRVPTMQTTALMAEIEKTDKTLVDLHFHDLRHEATSRLAEKLQMHELMKVTGHKSTSMLARYYHPRAEDLARKLA